MNIIDRILSIQAFSKLNKKDFSARIGIQQNTLYLQLSGQRAVSLDVVNAILNAYPNVSAEWLIRGKGTMFINDQVIDDRVGKLMDTIVLLQGTINENKKTINTLQEIINTYKGKR